MLLPAEIPVSGGQWIALAVGIALLAVGRKLYWLSWILLGFVMGLLAVDRFLGDVDPVVQLAGGLLAGIILAALAVVLQKVAVGAAGFLLGGFSLLWLIDHYGLDLGPWEWVVLLAGAAVFAVVLVGLFDVALVVLTSLVGAAILVRLTAFEGPPAMVLLLILLTIGVAIQTKSTKRRVQVID
jgi:hypothetical protein